MEEEGPVLTARKRRVGNGVSIVEPWSASTPGEVEDPGLHYWSPSKKRRSLASTMSLA